MAGFETRQKVELLSPAGDGKSLLYALRYGADAVYLGGKEFSMRTASENFSSEELEKAVALVHAQKKRVYLALNTLPTNEEVTRLPDVLRRAQEARVDAFIVADLGVLRLIQKEAPQVEIHFSTQAGIANYAGASAAFELGAKRVVLARELTLNDIAEIRDKTPKELELEVFVHGAMCMSVSGRCLLSQYLAGRSANRGNCAQSCRWKYSLHEEKRPGQSFEISEEEYGSYIMSADDLCTVEILDKIVAAGATSLKIEGRAKSFYYVASITAAYRAALNAVLALPRGEAYQCPRFSLEEVERTSHRPYSYGFFLGQEGATQSPHRGDYIRRWQVVGVVEKQQEGLLYCTQRGKFSKGDMLEALLPEGRTVSFMPKFIHDKEGQPIKATPHTMMAFCIPAVEGETFPQGSILRRQL